MEVGQVKKKEAEKAVAENNSEKKRSETKRM